MPQDIKLKIAGLYTSPNNLSSVPDGALTKAENIDIVNDDTAQPRRGFQRLAAGYSDNTDRTDQTWFYQSKQFAHHGPIYAADTISYYNSGAWTSVGTYSAPSDTKIRTLEANQNLLFTTSTGVKKLDAYNGTVGAAGAYKGLDIQATTTGASGFLANNYTCAYRVVWGYTDANGNLFRGAPSGRAVVTNVAGGTRNISVVTSIPSGVTTSWFYQLYRSSQLDNSSTTVTPSDELSLVYEGNPSAGDITAGYITVTDIVDDSLRGASLYTNATQEGLAYGNEQPPMAKDIATFAQCTFYANITNKHRYFLSLLSVGGTNGIAANDTIYIGGVTYTGKAAETIASAEFKVFTAGSASQNIQDTAQSLVKVINRHTNSTVYAYYLSGENDLPGMMLLEERSIGGSAFVVRSSRSTCWNPTGIPTSGDTETSTNESAVNGFCYSKPNEPEAVPLVNFDSVGSEDSEILRIIPMRDSLLFFKSDGIYRLTGSYPNFRTELLDSSAILVGKETPAVLNNSIFCLSDQGVIQVTDSVRIVSRPIEDDIKALFNADLDLVKSTSFGVAYETERRYQLHMVESDADTYPQMSFIYNVFTDAWTTHHLPVTCGVTFQNLQYLGDATSHYILEERKSGSDLDFADFGFTTAITTINGTTITLSSGVDLVDVGDILYQSDELFATITGTDTVNSTVTISSDPGLTVAAADILKSIAVDIEWVPLTLGNPGTTKQIHTGLVIFKEDFIGTAELAFVTDLSPEEETVDLTSTRGLGWGLAPWGSAAWGDSATSRPMRFWLPRLKQISSQLRLAFRHSNGFSAWKMVGLSLFGASESSEKVGR